MYKLLHGDCLALLPVLDQDSVESIVTDPPYGLSFMGKDWDHGVPGVAFWRAALRVAKPGGHLLAFGGTRTAHRLACAIEDAGWEIRDAIMWVYGSGFPKSHNLKGDWDGWGTALKPAQEPIVMARKPFPGTVAQNVMAWGTGAINVEACRVQGESDLSGRWPANLIHDGSEEVLAGFPVTGPSKAEPRGGTNPNPMDWGNARADGDIAKGHNDNGGNAARFFYCAKASKADRDEGLEGLPLRGRNEVYGNGLNTATKLDPALHTIEGVANRPQRRNHHPTVKPTDLMRYLCRLVTPQGGTVLDPFMGSGSTGKAALLEGFGFIGIEQEQDYIDIATARIGAIAAAPMQGELLEQSTGGNA